MDRYKFRGKRIDNGEWVTGYRARKYVNRGGKSYLGHFIQVVDEDSCKIDELEIDPKTVGQYTGRNDKNGGAIFKGDLLKVRMHNGNYEIYEIVWCVEYSSFEALNKERTNYISASIWNECEVIGNIHDSPLEVKG